MCVWSPTAASNSLRPSDEYMHRWQNHQWFRLWLVAWPAPSHYLNQWWDVVNWTLWNKLQWNFNRNSNIFIQENAFESVVCKIAGILSRPQCVEVTNLTTSDKKNSVIWSVCTWLMGGRCGLAVESLQAKKAYFRSMPYSRMRISLCLSFNPLRAKFLRESINIYLHIMSFLPSNKTQAVEHRQEELFRHLIRHPL